MASSDTTSLRDAIEFSLVLLLDECDTNQKNECISTIMKIFRNVLNNPGEAKYKEIKTTNKAFAEKVWKFKAAQQLLIATGWSEAQNERIRRQQKLFSDREEVIVVDDRVILLDDQYVTTAVQTLEQNHSQHQENRSTIPQSHSSRLETNPVLDENRRKQMEQMKREKDERKRIAEQIQADRKETKSRPTKPSVARPRQFGANINRYEDIGVDLNRGGG